MFSNWITTLFSIFLKTQTQTDNMTIKCYLFNAQSVWFFFPCGNWIKALTCRGGEEKLLTLFNLQDLNAWALLSSKLPSFPLLFSPVLKRRGVSCPLLLHAAPARVAAVSSALPVLLLDVAASVPADGEGKGQSIQTTPRPVGSREAIPCGFGWALLAELCQSMC